MLKGLGILLLGVWLLAGTRWARAEASAAWKNLPETWLGENFPQSGICYSVSILSVPMGWEANAAGVKIALNTDNGLRLKKIMRLPVTRNTATQPETGELLIRVARLQRVPVAARRLGRGESLHSGDWRWEEREAETVASDTVRTEEELAGKQARKFLMANEVLTAHALEWPPEIPAGQMFTLNIRGDGVVVSTDAKALEEGRLGKRIRCRLESGRQLQACVAGPGAAELVLSQRR